MHHRRATCSVKHEEFHLGSDYVRKLKVLPFISTVNRAIGRKSLQRLLSSDENRLESEEGLYDLSRSTQSMCGQGSISDPTRNDVKEQKHVLQDEKEVETADEKKAQEDEEATLLIFYVHLIAVS